MQLSVQTGKLKQAELSQAELFLRTRIVQLKASNRLKSALWIFGETLSEILSQCSRKDLLELRNFGKKTLAEFEALLKENNCLHLLRDKRVKLYVA